MASVNIGNVAWTSDHDEVIKAIETKETSEKFTELVEKINPNASHMHRDGDFSPLFHASIANNAEAFEILIQHGANPAWKNKFGTSVLKLIIKRNQVGMAKTCIESLDPSSVRKSFVNQSQSSGWTALMSCAEGDLLAMAKLLVESGAEVNIQMSTGWTALHAAAKMGSIATMEFLLQSGANKSLKASHRDFGRDLKVEDVTSNEQVLEILNRYNNNN